MFQYSLYLTLAPIAAGIAMITAMLAWRHRGTPGASALTWCLVTASGFLLMNVLELVDTTEAGTIMWAKLSYFFLPFVPVTWMAFIFEYTAQRKWLTSRRFWLLMVIPVATTIIVQTNDYHHLIWKGYAFAGTGNMQVLRTPAYGLWFWVQVVYSYALIAVGTFLITLQLFREHELYRKQTVWILTGTLIPLVFNLIYILRVIPGWTKDYSPVAFTTGSLFFAIGILRYRLFDLMPIARSVLIDRMGDGLIVLDAGQRIVDINRAARRMTGQTHREVIGLPVYELISLEESQLLPTNTDEKQTEITVSNEGEELQLELRTTRMVSQGDRLLGFLVTLHDQTRLKRLLAEVEMLARIDPLTGLFNRRYLLELAEHEIERSRRYHTPLSLVIIDLDGFKAINDTYGHLSGDEVLREVSTIIKKSMRSVDYPARFGGDEFVILLPETSLESARLAAERLCHRISGLTLSIRGIQLQMTMSIGVSGTTEVDNTFELDGLLEYADRALYASKSAGRNQVFAVSYPNPAIPYKSQEKDNGFKP